MTPHVRHRAGCDHDVTAVIRHYPCNCCDNNNFNVSGGWSRDVSENVARELLKRIAKEDKPLGGAARRFVEFHLGEAELLRAGIAD